MALAGTVFANYIFSSVVLGISSQVPLEQHKIILEMCTSYALCCFKGHLEANQRLFQTLKNDLQGFSSQKTPAYGDSNPIHHGFQSFSSMNGIEGL